MSDASSSFLECAEVEKRFGEHRALRGVSVRIAQGECLALLGPSGCGKSTLLNIISGLLRADDGRVSCDGVVMDDARARRFVPLRRRGFAMVFQDFSLWPHMTVAANVAFAPRMAGVSAAEREERVTRALARVRMDRFADRYPAQLSGGQQQRVAMARAIAASPRLLLLDEPLSALDAVLREELRDEIASLVRDIGITTVFVTHDQGEALAIADRVAIMRDGAIEQCGTAEEIYRRPASAYTAQFVGAANVVTVSSGGLVAVRREDLRFERHHDQVAPGLRGKAQAHGATAQWSGRVTACIYLGERFEIMLALEDGTTLRGYSDHGIEVGTALAAIADRDRLIELPSVGGERRPRAAPPSSGVDA